MIQYCSFEQSKKLVECGLLPISVFKYTKEGKLFKLDSFDYWLSFENRTYPAWTLGELIEIHSCFFDFKINSLSVIKAEVDSICSYLIENFSWFSLDSIHKVNNYLLSKIQ